MVINSRTVCMSYTHELLSIAEKPISCRKSSTTCHTRYVANVECSMNLQRNKFEAKAPNDDTTRNRSSFSHQPNMNAHWSSIMLRNAAKKASTLALSRPAWNAARCTNVPCSGLAITAKFTTSSKLNNRESEFGDSAANANGRAAPHLIEPLPALAYDYWDDDEEHDGLATMSGSSSAVNNDVTLGYNTHFFSHATKIDNSAGRTPSSPHLNPPFEGRSLPSRKSGGDGGAGGGNGRHRCPKCGTSVTFRHGDFEENTYYCATCSGWFLIDSNTTGDRNKEGSGVPAYEEYTTKSGSDGSSNKPQGPQIIMHHVSDDMVS